MALITWDDRYSVKVQKFDAQHKKLIEMINQLHEAMKVGKGKEAIGQILAALITYTQTHFAAEESAMRTYNYPDLDQHRKEHNLLVGKVLEIQKQQAQGTVVTNEVMNFLKDWLVRHIQGVDMKYAAFLSGKPII